MEIKGFYKHLLKEVDSVQYDSIDSLLKEFELKLYENHSGSNSTIYESVKQEKVN